MPDVFPRTTDLPSQSPLFWVNHKDRYLRQLLIRDIEAETQRDLIVYFTDCDRSSAVIDQTDDTYLSELLTATKSKSVDLLLETNGGLTDATEKICAILRNAGLDLRVIVPRRAKSNGTVIAFCGTTIVMGPDSELGPIDPALGDIPADFVIKAGQSLGQPLLVEAAKSVVAQTRRLASFLLTTGMLQGIQQADLETLLDKLATRNQYHSHGAVIDHTEATQLGLKVQAYGATDPLWKKVWLLRTMYAYDCQQKGYSKLFESSTISSPVALPKPVNG
ncbi:SDH family Clp fold serine proteinase [Burkholderia ambifaria]|uniref:SDH family Clp fold serine proteinase n=1 Tax=Burkholderia ambifaria TaxID=152480 RepID=UPI002FDFA22F